MNINNKDYLNLGASGLDEFDKDHSKYRAEQFMRYMLLREKQFIANYRFEGDDEFDLRTQRTFLKLLFRYGNAGILDPTKYKKIKINKEFEGILSELNLTTDDIVKKAFGTRIPIAVFPSHWNEYEKIVKGTGTTISRHNTGKKSYMITDENTAIGSYDSWGFSGWYWWMLPAYQVASGDLAIKKRLSLTDVKLVYNKVNNTNDIRKFDDVYNLGKSFIDMSPSQKSMTGDKASEINVATMLSNKLTKADFSNNETINDLMAFVKDYEAHIFKRMGVRVNMQANKEERSISKDFEADEVYWRRAEGELSEQMELFCMEYKRIFGKEIKVIKLHEEIQKELEEHEIKKAGHLNDVINKGGKDETTNKAKGN